MLKNNRNNNKFKNLKKPNKRKLANHYLILKVELFKDKERILKDLKEVQDCSSKHHLKLEDLILHNQDKGNKNSKNKIKRLFLQ